MNVNYEFLKRFIGFLIIFHFNCLTAVDSSDGYIFKSKSSYLQTNYWNLCNEIDIKLEVKIKEDRGVILYAINEPSKSVLLLRYERPGFYLNITYLNKTFGINYLIDFFEFNYIELHEIGIKIQPNDLSLKFNHINIKKPCPICQFVFPRKFIEDNQIYIGKEFHFKQTKIEAHRQSIKNIAYKGCGCNYWRNFEIIRMKDIDRQLGVCSDIKKSCGNSKCVCEEIRGTSSCDCENVKCKGNSDFIQYDFNKQWNYSPVQKLMLYDSNSQTTYDTNGMEQDALVIKSDKWFALGPDKSITCFKKLSQCYKGIVYSFWIQLLSFQYSFQILKHYNPSYKSIPSVLTLSISHNRLIAQLYPGYTIEKWVISLQVPLRIWKRYTISLTPTNYFCIYDETSSDKPRKCMKLNSSIPLIGFDSIASSIPSPLKLRVGGNIPDGAKIPANTDLFNIDLFQFTTSLDEALSNSLVTGGITELVYEKMDAKWQRYSLKNSDTNNNVIKSDKNGMIKLNELINMKLSKSGVYLSMIISTQLNNSIFIWETSNFKLNIRTTTIRGKEIIIELTDTKTIQLDTSQYIDPRTQATVVKELFYLELSLKDDGLIQVWLDYRFVFKMSHSTVKLFFNELMLKGTKIASLSNNWNSIQTFRYLSINKDIGTKLGRLVNNNFGYWTYKFDSPQLSKFKKAAGKIDQGIYLTGTRNKLNLPILSFKNSCLRQVLNNTSGACHHGNYLSVWLKFEKVDSDTSYLELFVSHSLSVRIEKLTEKVIVWSKGIGRDISVKKLLFVELSIQNACKAPKWCFLEVEKTELGYVMVYVDGKPGVVTQYDSSSIYQKEMNSVNQGCLFGVCLGGLISKSDTGSVGIDEMKLADISRQMVYVTEYMSRGPTRSKLFSFTDFELHSNTSNTRITLSPNVRLITTPTGQGLSLSEYGARKHAQISFDSGPSGCFASLLDCPRGILIRMKLRPDSLVTSPIQRWLNTQYLKIGSQNTYLTVSLLAPALHNAPNQKKGLLYTLPQEKVQLSVLEYTLIEVSWRRDDGMKVFVNTKLVSHIKPQDVRTRSALPISQNVSWVVGVADGNKSVVASGLLEDLEVVLADKTNLKYEPQSIDKVSCKVKENFQTHSQSNTIFGILGSGWCTNISLPASESDFRINLPRCFNDAVTGCLKEGCWSMRFWLMLVTVLMDANEASSKRIEVWASDSGVSLEILVEKDKEEGFILRKEGSADYFLCRLQSGYNNKMFRRWRFIEVSWHYEEGLLLFLDRVFVPCSLHSSSSRPQLTWRLGSFIRFLANQTSSSHGCLDEIEVYRNRLSTVYWSQEANSYSIKKILRSLALRERQRRVIMQLQNPKIEMKNEEKVESIQFKGDGSFVKFSTQNPGKTSVNSKIGMRKSIDIIFKLKKCNDYCVVWASEAVTSLNMLAVKKHTLIFTRKYTEALYSGKTVRRTEEVKVLEKIHLGLIYHVTVSQETGEITIRIKSVNSTFAKRTLGRDSLMNDENNNIYLGGLEKNHSFTGTIYQAKISTNPIQPDIDLTNQIAQQTKKSNITQYKIKKYGKVVINTTSVKIGSKEMKQIISCLQRNDTQSKLNLKFQSPFDWMKLKLDFDLIERGGLEFSLVTRERTGLIIFIGNNSRFFALELFHGDLFFVYKSQISSKAIRNKINTPSIQFTNSIDYSAFIDPRRYQISIRQDYLNNFILIVNHQLISSNLTILDNADRKTNTILVNIGFINLPDGVIWPSGILSRIGMTGCIQQMKFGDLGYMDFNTGPSCQLIQYSSQFTPSSILKLSSNCALSYPPSTSHNPCISSSKHNVCKNNGLCIPMSNQLLFLTPSQKLPNYQCSCQHSYKNPELIFFTKNSSLSQISPIKAWLWSYMYKGRGGHCVLNSPSRYVGQSHHLHYRFKQSFSVESVVEFEMQFQTERSDGCLVELFNNGASNSDLNKQLVVTMTLINGSLVLIINQNSIEPNKLSSITHILNGTINSKIWHVISLKMAYTSGQLQFDYLKTQFTLPVSYTEAIRITDVSIGNCPWYSRKRTNYIADLKKLPIRIKKPIYNSLPLLLVNFPPNYNALFQLKYNKPSFSPTRPDNSSFITLKNNFRFAQTRYYKCKLYNQIIFSYKIRKSRHVSSIMILNLAEKSEILLKQIRSSNIDLIYKRNKITKKISVPIVKLNSFVTINIIIDLINNEIYLLDTLTNKKTSFINEIDDWLKFGDEYKMALGGNRNESSLVGCVSTFGVWDGEGFINIVRSFTDEFKKVIPALSVEFDKCLDVEACTRSICNNGICKPLDDGYRIRCDCSSLSRGSPDRIYSGKYCQFSTPSNNSISSPETTVNENATPLPTKQSFIECQTPSIKTCNLNGSVCKYSNRTTSNYCQCKSGFFGASCNISSRGSVKNECKKCGFQTVSDKHNMLGKAVCSPFIITNQLCEQEQICDLLDKNETIDSQLKFKCQCETTIYRGRYCTEEEIGFYPSKTGPVIMKQPNNFETESAKFEYIRILFEDRNKPSNYTVFMLELSSQKIEIKLAKKAIQLISENVKAFNIGATNLLNVLMIVITKYGISVSLNDQIVFIPINQLSAVSGERVRRATDISDSHLTVGCSSKYHQCFPGIIGGVRWNDKNLTHPSNLVYRSGSFLPIKDLHTHKFRPTVEKSKNKWSWLLILFLLCLFLLIILVLGSIIICNIKRNKKINQLKYSSPINNQNSIDYTDQIYPHSYIPMNVQITPSSRSKISLVDKRMQDVDGIDELLIPSNAEELTMMLPIKASCSHLITLEKEYFEALQGCKVADMKAIPNTNRYLVLYDGETIYSENVHVLHTTTYREEICDRIFFTQDMDYIGADISRIVNNYSYQDTNQPKLYTLKLWNIRDKIPKPIPNTLTLSTLQYTHSTIYPGSSVPKPSISPSPDSNKILLFHQPNNLFQVYCITTNSIIDTFSFNAFSLLTDSDIISIHPTVCTPSSDSSSDVVLFYLSSSVPSYRPLFFTKNGSLHPVITTQTIVKVVYVRQLTFFLLTEEGLLLELNLENMPENTNNNSDQSERNFETNMAIIKNDVVKLEVAEYKGIRRIAVMLENKQVLILLNTIPPKQQDTADNDQQILKKNLNLEAEYPWIKLSPMISRQDIQAINCTIGFSWNCQHIYRIYNSNQLHLWNLQAGSNICRFYRLNTYSRNLLLPSQVVMSPDCNYIATIIANEASLSFSGNTIKRNNKFLSQYVTVGSIETVILKKSDMTYHSDSDCVV